MQVFIVGLTFAQQGVAAKVTFSLRRTGKKIIWKQSKRLIQGTLVALTPVDDMFQTICKVAVVAARPLSGVQSNPPAIDVRPLYPFVPSHFYRSKHPELSVDRSYLVDMLRNFVLYLANDCITLDILRRSE